MVLHMQSTVRFVPFLLKSKLRYLPMLARVPAMALTFSPAYT